MPQVSEPLLSVILPYYRKLADFKRVLPLNSGYFARTDLEVVLVLDEGSEEAALLDFLHPFKEISWKVIVNDQPHAWRPPCKAINVGLRHASGQFVLICSPESAFVGDVPALALRVVQENPHSVAAGRVAFAQFDALDNGTSIDAVFSNTIPAELTLQTFYGSVCAARSTFEAVRGYDESFGDWGGDDDNVRIRMEMAGHPLLACPGMRILHLSEQPRTGGELFDPVTDVLKCSPASAQANETGDWGRDFSRIALRTQGTSKIPGVSTPLVAEHPAPLPAGTFIPFRSRRRCGVCGRTGHYESPRIYCTHCNAVDIPVARQSPPLKIVAVMQLRNEAYYLPGCLAHLCPYVDGIIALDDGSTDATSQILAAEPKVIRYITKPPVKDHVWNERGHKQMLLQEARNAGADWILVCDADERYETGFLQNLHPIAQSLSDLHLPFVQVSVKELWNSALQYRDDGIWGAKRRDRFFRLPPQIRYDNGKPLHGSWCPDQILDGGQMVRTYHYVYHLKSIHHTDRIARRDLYKRLDPDNQWQPIGYDYLAEDGDTARTVSIPPHREYDRTTLPADLQKT